MEVNNNTGWDGTPCPKCGCRRLDVYYTRHRKGGTFRVRICQLCGRKVPTLELPIGTPRNAVESPAKRPKMGDSSTPVTPGAFA